MPDNVKRPYLFLAAAATCLLGVTLRFYRIDLDSIYGDEGFTYFLVTRSFDAMLTHTANDVHPPLYYALLHLIVSWFGRAEAVLRGISALLGAMTLVGMYLLGTRLFGRVAGLFAAVLMAVSPFHILYSQQARMYTLFSALCVFSFFFLVQLWEKRTGGWLIGFAVITAAMLYTHYYAGFVVFGQALFMAWHFLVPAKRKQAGWILGGLVLTTILYAPWLPTLYRQMVKVHGDYWMTAKGMVIVNAVIESAAGAGLYWYFVAGIAVALIPSGLLGKSKAQPARSGATLLIALWIAASVGLPVLISFERPIFTSRHSMAAVPALVLMFAYGISKLKHWNIRWLVFAAYAVMLSAPLEAYYTREEAAPWRQVGEIVRAGATSGDLVLYFPGWQGWNARYYLETVPGLELQQFPLKGETVVTEALVEPIFPLLEGKRGVWLIEGTAGDKDRLMQKAIESKMELIATQTAGPFSIRRFAARSTQPTDR